MIPVQEKQEDVRNGRLIFQCCVCRRISRDRDHWRYFLPEMNADGVQISHGYCAKCFTSAYSELETLIAQRRHSMMTAVPA